MTREGKEGFEKRKKEVIYVVFIGTEMGVYMDGWKERGGRKRGEIASRIVLADSEACGLVDL